MDSGGEAFPNQIAALNADSEDCGQLFRLKPDSHSDRSRTAFR
jgi:hypothetical protein